MHTTRSNAGMVTAPHALAAQAGARILAEGFQGASDPRSDGAAIGC
jgi:gamma-glutamyltranspeptidase